MTCVQKLVKAQQRDCDKAFMGSNRPYSQQDEYGHLQIAPESVYGGGADAASKEELDRVQVAPVKKSALATLQPSVGVRRVIFEDDCLEHLKTYSKTNQGGNVDICQIR